MRWRAVLQRLGGVLVGFGVAVWTVTVVLAGLHTAGLRFLSEAVGWALVWATAGLMVTGGLMALIAFVAPAVTWIRRNAWRWITAADQKETK